MLKIEETEAIGQKTLETFLQSLKEHHFGLSEAGVNIFKEKHGLGNAPPWTGVIGAETDQVYFNEFISLIYDGKLDRVAYPHRVWIWYLSKLRSDYLEKLSECKVKRV